MAADAFDCHQAVTDGQQQAAEQHCLALPEITVRQIAAENRRDVHQAGIGAVDQVRLGVIEQPVLRQVENQQRPHAVVGEALPHFGEEEHVKALRVPGEFRLLLDRGLGADRQEDGQDEDCNCGDPVAFGPCGKWLQTHVGHSSQCAGPPRVGRAFVELGGTLTGKTRL